MTFAPSAAAVANQFLKFGEREGIDIDQLKLQKLLFYAHAWHLAIRDRPLFDEDFQAWPWGPVVREIYVQTSKWGRAPIQGRLHDIEHVGDEPLNWKRITPDGVSDTETVDFLEGVWNVHKAYSGVQLSNSTHAPGEPWTRVKEYYGSLDTRPVIPNALIDAVFKQKRKDHAARNSAA